MKYEITVTATIDYHTSIECDTEDEAKDLAKEELIYNLPDCKIIDIDAF